MTSEQKKQKVTKWKAEVEEGEKVTFAAKCRKKKKKEI